MKRLMTDNTGPNGNLDTDAFHRAIMQYRNTPDPVTHLSPAMCLFGRNIRDFIPSLPGKYKLLRTWQDTLASRESALHKRGIQAQERLSEHTKRLLPLKVGDHVRIQNQTGPYPLKWDKTGTVVEVRQYNQYVVKKDGSNKTTLRNRKFLRLTTMAEASPPIPIIEDFRHLQVTRNQTVAPETHSPLKNCQEERSAPLVQTPQNQMTPIGPENSTNTMAENTPRRSNRTHHPTDRLQYSKLGTPE